MMSFELRFDADTDAAIRAEWAALLDAGLPSQARHASASNAPHFTVLAAREVNPELVEPNAHPESAAAGPDGGMGRIAHPKPSTSDPAGAAGQPGGPRLNGTVPASLLPVAVHIGGLGRIAPPKPATPDPAGAASQPGGPRLNGTVPASLLPVAVHIGGLVVFGGPPRGLVLGRLVAVSPALQALHTSVHRRASGIVDLSELSAPGRWVPHVTLANRLTPAQLADAIDVLAKARPAVSADPVSDVGSAVTLWHWTGSTKTLTLVDA
ncbi:2'-5' RNA ligase family protein [Subtercola boreus]|uniref:2'-5' RNA ligase n=1 Tax=Subtercola boreus TaxID=120213 RepID=A0A3E0WA32_9MICO|nr:2'-5' RNA ligase family protein [Subtercola boreus]RFA19866.1 hypothetical protein B7R24_11155 [Subtercola boreus]RFA19933.1 hypothetical protein B7R23_11135 [Subtercola boreus]RFA26326.1 hypothetical protein B7R25_11255 [Subtercola boreus]